MADRPEINIDTSEHRNEILGALRRWYLEDPSSTFRSIFPSEFDLLDRLTNESKDALESDLLKVNSSIEELKVSGTQIENYGSSTSRGMVLTNNHGPCRGEPYPIYRRMKEGWSSHDGVVPYRPEARFNVGTTFSTLTRNTCAFDVLCDIHRLFNFWTCQYDQLTPSQVSRLQPIPLAIRNIMLTSDFNRASTGRLNAIRNAIRKVFFETNPALFQRSDSSDTDEDSTNFVDFNEIFGLAVEGLPQLSFNTLALYICCDKELALRSRGTTITERRSLTLSTYENQPDSTRWAQRMMNSFWRRPQQEEELRFSCTNGDRCNRRPYKTQMCMDRAPPRLFIEVQGWLGLQPKDMENACRAAVERALTATFIEMSGRKRKVNYEVKAAIWRLNMAHFMVRFKYVDRDGNCTFYERDGARGNKLIVCSGLFRSNAELMSMLLEKTVDEYLPRP